MASRRPPVEPPETPELPEDTGSSRHAERQRTDADLKDEREHTDRELGRRGEGLAARTDALVGESRGETDRGPGALPDERPAARQLVDERAATDRAFEDEREERHRLLERILDEERGRTDVSLQHERLRGDELLENRDAFLAMVTHDLRSLLVDVSLQAELLSRGIVAGKDTGELAGRAKDILACTARMGRLIGDLVDVVSLDVGRLSVDRRPGDLRGLMRDVTSHAAPSAVSRGIEVELELPAVPVIVLEDEQRIEQVLANLLGNAIKFSPEGGRVVAEVELLEHEALVSVTNAGEGIPRDDLTAVFERHWQRDESDRRGLGLGLYIAHQIVAAHGGQIWAESQPGLTTTFRFTLPRAPLDDVGAPAAVPG